MQRLMGVNRGLKSRFPELITFRSLQPRDCLSLLVSQLARESFLDISALQVPQESFTREALARFEILTELDDWANARDVETLAKSTAREKLYNADSTSDALLVMTEGDVLTGLDEMLQERHRRMAPSPGAAMEEILQVIPSVQQALDSQDLKLSAVPKTSTTATEVAQNVSQDVPMAKICLLQKSLNSAMPVYQMMSGRVWNPTNGKPLKKSSTTKTP